MIELRRIIVIDWYRFRAQQVDMRGMTAIVGPNGAGKSAIIDAVQTVLTGASMASIRFNPSAQSNVRSKRTLRDYCLGVVSLDEKGERSEPTRQNAYARAFLNYRIGHLMLVETMDKMVAAENAITPDLVMQGGRTVRRLQKPRYLKLSRDHARPNAPTASCRATGAPAAAG